MLDLESIKARLSEAENDKYFYCEECFERSEFIYNSIGDVAALVAEVESLQEERELYREVLRLIGSNLAEIENKILDNLLFDGKKV